MKLSMMSYTMTRQKEHFDLKAMFELTKELKMDGIDLVTLIGMEAKDLRKMADDYGIPVVCHTFHADLAHPDPAARRAGVESVKQGIEAAVTLGAPVTMIPTPHKKDVARDDLRRYWIAGLKESIGIAKDAGITLTIENFPGMNSPFVIADDVLEAIEAVPGLKLTFDSGNAGTGEDPVKSFERCAEHVVHAHFKDWEFSTEADGGRKMLDGRFYKSALIGEGVINNAGCVAAMEKAGYAGYINIEYEGNKYRPDEAVRRVVDYLRSL